MRHFPNLQQLKEATDTSVAHFIQPALPNQLVGNEYYLFSNDQLQRPIDPMAEFIIVPGRPFQLVAECEKRAMQYELLGLSILGLGIGITELLVFFFFTYVLV